MASGEEGQIPASVAKALGVTRAALYGRLARYREVRVELFSYARELWPQRLAWFRLHAAHRLISTINGTATGNDGIVCDDGVTATIVTPEGVCDLTRGRDPSVRISVRRQSGLVCDMTNYSPRTWPSNPLSALARLRYLYRGNEFGWRCPAVRQAVGRVFGGQLGYAVSQIRRKRVEEIFGWMKGTAGKAKTRFRGLRRVAADFLSTMTAYNLIRIARLELATG